MWQNWHGMYAPKRCQQDSHDGTTCSEVCSFSYLTAFRPSILSNFSQLCKESVDVDHLHVNHVPESGKVLVSRNVGIFGYS